MTTIEINGEPMHLTSEGLSDILRARGVEAAGRGFAVAVNGTLVPRAQWAETRLRGGDRIEIVRAFAGG